MWLRRFVGKGDGDGAGGPPPTVDLSGATFRLDLPKFGMTRLTPRLDRSGGSRFVAGAVLATKAKQFDDGLYAAVELAAEEGLGAMTGKRALLERVLERLSGDGRARAVVEAAAVLGGVRDEASPAAEAVIASFLAQPLSSKPLGFYTWSERLERIFRQDRMLQSDLREAGDLAALAAIVSGDPAYAAHLELPSRLTNPLACADLRDPGTGRAVAFLPPSIAHETELVKRLYGDRPIPEGFSLTKELASAIRAGSVDLTPKPSSGWYDVQTWALETLVAPERGAESAKLVLEERYREHLEGLFAAILAVTRETHVKQLEMPPAGAAMRRPTKIVVRPELSVEPLPTYYARRAESYRFVRALLVERFGDAALGTMHRLRRSGPVEVDLATELGQMIALFDGAAAASRADLGMPAEGDAAPLHAWAASEDPDVDEDPRMMVPVYYDVLRKKTKVWMILGWSRTYVQASFAAPPRVTLEGGAEADVELAGAAFPLSSLVMAEALVTDVLDRDAFRAHCDKYRAEPAIVSSLV
jgi:hypothetical protein